MTETTAPSADLRFPIGRFSRPETTTAESRAAAVEAIAAMPAALRAAIAGLSEAQLDTPYRPGGWTVRQLVHHVADSHMNAYVRMKLAATEDMPAIKPYDEQRWAELPEARTLPVEVSLALIESLHTRWVAFMRALTPEQFARAVRHPDWDRPLTIDTMAALYGWHARHHVAHVTALREREGWTAAEG